MMIKVSRDIALNMLLKIRNEVEENSNLSEFYIKLFDADKIEKSEFEVYYQGVSNGFIAELINAITGYELEVFGDTEELLSCPCCGYKTLTEVYDVEEGTGYDICPYCKWEDDGTVEINKTSSVNRGTIEEYRMKIKQNENKYYISKWKKACDA